MTGPVPPPAGPAPAPEGPDRPDQPAPEAVPAQPPAPAVIEAGAVREREGTWRRVHPLTPVVRSWQLVVVVLIVVAQSWGDDVVRGQGLPGPGRLDGRWLLGGGAVLVLVIAGIGLSAYVSWRMTRFRITEDALELYQGVFYRQHRRARLDRLQAVDVVQPLIARLVGLARLTLEVAGGNGSGVTLSYLTEAEARSLRNHLLARAAGVRYETEEAPEAPEHQTLEVPTGRLVGSLALSGSAVALVGGALVLLVSGVVLRRVEPLVAIGPMVFATAGVLWARFNAGFAFRVATSPDGVRLRYGLLEHRSQTVPPGRVQALRISQPPLWRPADWWRVQLTVAGYGEAGGGDASPGNVLLPVGTREEAIAVAALVFPDLGVEPAEETLPVVHAGLAGDGPGHGYLTSPPAARWADPVGWRRTGARVTGEALLIRHGRWWRVFDVVPHARSQSWGLTQGPLQRRWGLASFALHSTPGPVTPQVPHLAADEAARLLEGQAERARGARERARPERWMAEG